jgi:regulator of protease activity HflC (stomatin/prohibitin superfamily)
LAEGYKQEIVLRSEAAYVDQVNRAKGQAEAVTLVAEATSKSIEIIANSINKQGGEAAVSMKIAENYIEAFKELAKEGTTIIVPATTSDASSMISQALTIFDNIKSKKQIVSPWNKNDQ